MFIINRMEYVYVKSFAVELLEQLEPNFSSIERFAKYLGFKVEKSRKYQRVI